MARYLALPLTRAHHAELRRRAAARDLAEGADGRATGAIARIEDVTGPWAHAVNGTYDLWEVNEDGSQSHGGKYSRKPPELRGLLYQACRPGHVSRHRFWSSTTVSMDK